MSEEQTRALIKKRIAEGTLDVETMRAEAILKDTPAVGGRRAEGRSCACWRGQLCQFHNLMYHGQT